MQMDTLEWDSELFGYEVSKLVLREQTAETADYILRQKFRLLYIFSDTALSKTFAEKTGAYLADEKITFSKEVPNEFFAAENNCLKEISLLDKDVLELAYQSGEYSRFKTDPAFANAEFEKLYLRWIERSIEKEIADKVVGCVFEGKTIALLTLSNNKSDAEIGLLAVSKDFRGRNIGSALLDHSVLYAKHRSLHKVFVSTQSRNTRAMNFYMKNGFAIANKLYVYHLWK